METKVYCDKKYRMYYDKDYDNLIISQKENNEKIKKNFMFDDIVIGIARSGKVVSIEVMDISNFLKEMGFDPKILDNMVSARLDIKAKKDFLMIGFQIQAKKPMIEQRVPVANIPITCVH